MELGSTANNLKKVADILQLIVNNLDHIKFTFIKEDEVYFKVLKDLRIRFHPYDENEVHITYRGIQISINSYSITAGGISHPNVSVFSWDETSDDPVLFDHTWADIESEEDFFQKSLVLDFNSLSYRDILNMRTVVEETAKFAKTDMDTQYRIQRYKWNKRKGR